MRRGFDWAGYEFHALGHHDGRFIKQAGLYIFVRRCGDDRTALYIDHSDYVARDADPSHRVWSDALALGMNELHVFTRPRDRVERLLVLDRVVRRCLPLLNLLHAPLFEGEDRAVCAAPAPPRPTGVVGRRS